MAWRWLLQFGGHTNHSLKSIYLHALQSSTLTHQTITPWDKDWNTGHGKYIKTVPIPIEAIKQFYETKANLNEAAGHQIQSDIGGGLPPIEKKANQEQTRITSKIKRDGSLAAWSTLYEYSF